MMTEPDALAFLSCLWHTLQVAHDRDISIVCNRLYVGSEDGQLRIFNWHNGVCINELLSDANTEITMIENASSTRRKYTLATGWNRILYVWKVGQSDRPTEWLWGFNSDIFGVRLQDPPEGYKQSLHAKIDPGFDCEITSLATWDPSEVAFGLYDGKSVVSLRSRISTLQIIHVNT